MKKIFTGICIAVFMIAIVGTATVMAGYGHGTRVAADGMYGRYYGMMNGTFCNILEGEPFEYNGNIVGFELGNGIVVKTIEGNDVILYGIGPVHYWDSIGISRPVKGDTINAQGYMVNYNNETRNIMTQITLNGQEVQLRDFNTGAPLWRGMGYHGQRMGYHGRGMGHHGRGMGYHAMMMDISSGQPFDYKGKVTQINRSLVLTTSDNENISFYGIGPVSYWTSIGQKRPNVGDTIQVKGYKVAFNGIENNIITSVLMEDGQEIELRDSSTGMPLWRNRYNGTCNMFSETNHYNHESMMLFAGRGRGPGDGTGNGGNGPKDGTGNGSRSGDCINS